MPKFINTLAAAALSVLTMAGMSSAKAVTMQFDPGPAGSLIDVIPLNLTPGDIAFNSNTDRWEFHVVFANMNHLEFTMPTGIDILTPAPGQNLPPVFLQGDFYLTDEHHLEIDGTRRSFAFFAGLPFPLPGIFDPVIFHDFHFEFLDNPFPGLPEIPGNVTIAFTDQALVGVWVSEPGTLAVFGLGLLGLGLIRRQKRAA